LESAPPRDPAGLELQLRRCLALMRIAPLDFGLRVQAGELLVALNDAARGIRVLRSCADYFTLAGFPVRALWALKLLNSVGADGVVVERGLSLLAEHYAGASDRVWGDPIFEPSLPKRREVDLTGLPGGLSEVIAEVERRSTDIIRGATFPDRLPRFPLLSQLGREPFLTVVRAIRLRRVASGAALVEEEQPGNAVYVIVKGRATVSKAVAGAGRARLAELGEGDIFGEMALVTESPRVATVTAEGPVDVFELPRTVLTELGSDASELQTALSRQVCDRMVHNLMNLSPVFQAVPADRRGTLLSRLGTHLFDAEEDIIVEGQVGRGLFIVLDGLIQVTRRKAGHRHVLSWLREGDIFGEISLMKNTPATATCTASRRSLLMFLPRDEFAQVIEEHPELAVRLTELGDHRLLDNLYTLA